jgi:hypothetical protein
VKICYEASRQNLSGSVQQTSEISIPGEALGIPIYPGLQASHRVARKTMQASFAHLKRRTHAYQIFICWPREFQQHIDNCRSYSRCWRHEEFMALQELQKVGQMVSNPNTPPRPPKCATALNGADPGVFSMGFLEMTTKCLSQFFSECAIALFRYASIRLKMPWFFHCASANLFGQALDVSMEKCLSS